MRRGNASFEARAARGHLRMTPLVARRGAELPPHPL